MRLAYYMGGCEKNKNNTQKKQAEKNKNKKTTQLVMILAVCLSPFHQIWYW